MEITIGPKYLLLNYVMNSLQKEALNNFLALVTPLLEQILPHSLWTYGNIEAKTWTKVEKQKIKGIT